MAPMTFIFQLCNSVVKGIQLIFQSPYFVLNWKSPTGMFIDGWFLLWSRCS
jgi:hypothetical protein